MILIKNKANIPLGKGKSSFILVNFKFGNLID